jgi:hypothetical protein
LSRCDHHTKSTAAKNVPDAPQGANAQERRERVLISPGALTRGMQGFEAPRRDFKVVTLAFKRGLAG